MNAEKLRQFSSVALSTYETVVNSYQCAETCLRDNVAGEFVECGVYAGTQCAAMAQALLENMCDKSGRRVHLFDSFQGIPLPGPEDGADIGALFDQPRQTQFPSACSQKQVAQFMMRWGIPWWLLVYHIGWFQDTVPTAEIGQIAVLRLDGDLYESTQICLKHLAPRVQHGGFIIVDDWELVGCRKACDEYISTLNYEPVIVQVERSAPRYWRVP